AYSSLQRLPPAQLWLNVMKMRFSILYTSDFFPELRRASSVASASSIWRVLLASRFSLNCEGHLELRVLLVWYFFQTFLPQLRRSDVSSSTAERHLEHLECRGISSRRFSLNCEGHLEWRVLLDVSSSTAEGILILFLLHIWDLDITNFNHLFIIKLGLSLLFDLR
ncbi:hypothetical protein L9F63_019607, partial [Diploptera punctata]